jgi:anti-sigma B factor antagonist
LTDSATTAKIDEEIVSSSFEIQQHDHHISFVLRGSLDINSAPSLAESIDRVLAQKPSRVVVDLAGLDLIDSSGVAALVKLYKGLRGQNSQMEMLGVRDQPLAIFKLLRMDKVFGI